MEGGRDAVDKLTSLLYIIVANKRNLYLVKSVLSVSGVNSISLVLVKAESLDRRLSFTIISNCTLTVLKNIKTISGCPVCFKIVWLRYPS